MPKLLARSKSRLLWGFGLSFLTLMFTSFLSFWSVNALLDSERWVHHTQDVRYRLGVVLSRIKDAESGQRGFLLTADESFLDAYTNSYVDVMESFQEAEELTHDNHLQQMVFPWLQQLIDAKYGVITRTIDSKRHFGTYDPNEIRNGRVIMNKIRGLIKLMIVREEHLLKQRTERETRISSYAPLTILITLVVSVLSSIYFYLKIKTDYQHRLMLEQELIEKNVAITRQIDTLDKFAKNIAAGDYKTRITEKDLS